MAVRAPGESGAELCYLWPLNAASSATIRFLPPPHVTEGTPPFSFYLCCSGALWEMWFCVHLRCPWVTHHCSPSRFFSLHSLFQNGDNGLILFCIIFENLGSNKVLFYCKYIHTYGEFRGEAEVPAPLRTHTGLRNCTHDLLSNHLSSFTACLIHWVTFSQISHQTQIIYFTSFFFFCPDQTVDNSVINSTILKVV